MIIRLNVKYKRLVPRAPQQSSGHAQTYLTQIKEEITAYFQGSKKSFQTPLVFSGTAFQQDTWRALECIPYGVKWTYTDLAEAIHKPKAVRAAASASKKNPFMVAIPCHRVLYKSGNMGGYSGGPERKKWLLAHETKYTNF